MELLPFGKLPPYRPRTFVPADMELNDWPLIEKLFKRLAKEIETVDSAQALEAWLMRWSELNGVLDEESNRRYIAMTCHTENAEAERAYMEWVEEIDPRIKPWQFELTQAFTQHSYAPALPGRRFEVLLRDARNQVELFRPENVPLETEESKLSQQYQKLAGSLTVQFEGQEQTLIQMGRYLERTDRALRQQAWELITNRRLAAADEFEEIFDSLLSLRDRIARNAGFQGYEEYMFRRLGRYDYTPADCKSFHDAVESEVMPLVRELQDERRRYLRLDTLRPWDLGVDPLMRPPLKPFEQVPELVAGTRRVFDQLDPELAEGFRQMDSRRLLDLANRKGKAPGGYQSTLGESRLPFIFMNAVGLQRDVDTILHEAGHAFHALATQEEDLYAYRNPPIEICEVASMSMELLAADFLGEFYSADDANRARRTHLEGIVNVLPWICTVDAFQSWIYSNPRHTHEERAAAWSSLMDRFGGSVDWRGYERGRALLWHRQLHIFTHAFYYIEYGIAQLGALQVWANSRRDKSKALKQYKEALALGASRPLPELFAAAGCNFRFDRATLAPLIAMLREELDRLPSAPDLNEPPSQAAGKG